MLVKRTMVRSGGTITQVLVTLILLLVLQITTLLVMVLLDSDMDTQHLVLVPMLLHSEILLQVVHYSVLVELPRKSHSMTTKISHYSISLLHLSLLVTHTGSAGLLLLLLVDSLVLVDVSKQEHMITTMVQ